jgi:hypothetical protein
LWLGLASRALLSGLGDVVASLLVAGAVSLSVLVVSAWLRRREAVQGGSERRLDFGSSVLAAACFLTSLGAAAALLYLEFAGATTAAT